MKKKKIILIIFLVFIFIAAALTITFGILFPDTFDEVFIIPIGCGLLTMIVGVSGALIKDDE